MAYADVSDLIKRFGIDELIAVMPGPGPESYDLDQVSISILDASDEADSYLAERFKTPLENIPNILTL